MRWPGRHRSPPPEASRPPDGWPEWLPVPGGHSARDIVPTHRFWDVLRLFHRDPAVLGSEDDGWPTPVPVHVARLSLCDAVGRKAAAIGTPGAAQADLLLDALGTDDQVDALVGVVGDHVRQQAVAHGWPLVEARHVQPDLPVYTVAFARDLSRDDAVTRLTGGGLSHLWSGTWVVRSDPWGEASSSIVAGVSGTAERLRRSGLDVLPVGHAVVWPPVCATCDPQAAAAAHEHHDHP